MLYLYISLLINKAERIFIFDIDNTLANTWPSLTYNINSRKERLSGLSVFINMRFLIRQIIQDKKNKVIFLTSRNNYDLFVTCNWLRSVGINCSIFDVIIVGNPKTKIRYIKSVVRFYNQQLIYIDDLTYNHERGNMKKYSFVKDIYSLPIQYFGYKFILAINDAKLDRNIKYENIFSIK